MGGPRDLAAVYLPPADTLLIKEQSILFHAKPFIARVTKDGRVTAAETVWKRVPEILTYAGHRFWWDNNGVNVRGPKTIRTFQEAKLFACGDDIWPVILSKDEAQLFANQSIDPEVVTVPANQIGLYLEGTAVQFVTRAGSIISDGDRCWDVEAPVHRHLTVHTELLGEELVTTTSPNGHALTMRRREASIDEPRTPVGLVYFLPFTERRTTAACRLVRTLPGID